MRVAARRSLLLVLACTALPLTAQQPSQHASLQVPPAGGSCGTPSATPFAATVPSAVRSASAVPLPVRRAPAPLPGAAAAARRAAGRLPAGAAASRDPAPVVGGTTSRAAWAATVRPAYADSLRAFRRVADSLIAAAPAGLVMRGDSAAPLTILEFLDFQCPYCAMQEREGGRAIEAYVRRGLVRVAMLDFPLPFHRQAPQAAMFYHCAVAAGAEPAAVRARLYAEQGAWGAGDPVPVFTRLAAALVKDTAAVAACYAEGRFVPALVHGIRVGRALGITGTPGYFLAGRPQSGAGDAASVQARLEALLLGTSAPPATPTPWLETFVRAVSAPEPTPNAPGSPRRVVPPVGDTRP